MWPGVNFNLFTESEKASMASDVRLAYCGKVTTLCDFIEIAYVRAADDGNGTVAHILFKRVLTNAPEAPALTLTGATSGEGTVVEVANFLFLTNYQAPSTSPTVSPPVSPTTVSPTISTSGKTKKNTKKGKKGNKKGGMGKKKGGTGKKKGGTGKNKNILTKTDSPLPSNPISKDSMGKHKANVRAKDVTWKHKAKAGTNVDSGVDVTASGGSNLPLIAGVAAASVCAIVSIVGMFLCYSRNLRLSRVLTELGQRGAAGRESPSVTMSWDYDYQLRNGIRTAEPRPVVKRSVT